jgi:hypothetical protein
MAWVAASVAAEAAYSVAQVLRFSGFEVESVQSLLAISMRCRDELEKGTTSE